jgi:hypothetical protein
MDWLCSNYIQCHMLILSREFSAHLACATLSVCDLIAKALESMAVYWGSSMHLRVPILDNDAGFVQDFHCSRVRGCDPGMGWDENQSNSLGLSSVKSEYGMY